MSKSFTDLQQEFLDKHYGGSKEAFQKDLIRIREELWANCIEKYDQNPQDFFAAWQYLHEHPIFQGSFSLQDSRFGQVLDIGVAKVNPLTKKVADDESLNTKTEVWLEAGPTWRKSDPGAEEYVQAWGPEMWPSDGVITNVHDYKIDAGGDDFESAIIDMARLVRLQYGDDRSKVYEKSEESWWH